MIINVGLRFNRSAKKFWVSGVTQSDKDLINDFIKGYGYSEFENKLSTLLFNQFPMAPQDDKELEAAFNLLTPMVESILNVDSDVQINVVETEVVNNW